MPRNTITTLDFEASSLDEDGFPVEVAFVVGTQTGTIFQFSTLIRPRTDWKLHDGWSEASQLIHGIDQADLAYGMDADEVCDILNRYLAGMAVIVDGGSYDAFWLDRLYDGRPKTFILDHLEHVDPQAFIAKKQAAVPMHRALPDALWLWATLAKMS